MYKFPNVFKIKTLKLEDDNNVFNSVMAKCSSLYINDHLQLIIKNLYFETIVVDLSDIFFHNHLAFPDKKDYSLIYYETNTCLDLSSLIKSISWKNNTIIISEPSYIFSMIKKMQYEIASNPTKTYFYEINGNTINICSDFFGLKYQHGEDRLFLVYNGKIIFCNMDNIYVQDHSSGKNIETILDDIIKIFGVEDGI